MRRPLRLVYEDRGVLRRALEGDLARGGAFLPCDDPPPLQARVVVAVELPFAKQRILLDADVVHRVEPGSSPQGAGVGVQFLEAVEALCARFAPFVAEGPPPAAPAKRAKAPQAAGRAAPAGGDAGADGLFDSDDLFDDLAAPAASGAASPASSGDDDLSDADLEEILASGAIEEAIDDALAPAEGGEEEKGDPFGWFDPGARALDPEAEVEGSHVPGPAPGDPSFDPAEIAMEADDEPIPELGTPGTGHRTRADD